MQVFFLVPGQFRKKLQNTFLLGIFIGYDSNPRAYGIYDINNNKVVISRSVVFFKNTRRNCSSPYSIPDIINLIPYHEIWGSNNEVSVDFKDNNMGNNESTINNDNSNNNNLHIVNISDNNSNMDVINNTENSNSYKNKLNYPPYYYYNYPPNYFIQNYPYQYNLDYPYILIYPSKCIHLY